MNADASQHRLFAEAGGQQEEVRTAPTFGESLLALEDIKGLGRKGLRALVTVFKDDLSEVWNTHSGELRGHWRRPRSRPRKRFVSQWLLRAAHAATEKGAEYSRYFGLRRFSAHTAAGK